MMDLFTFSKDYIDEIADLADYYETVDELVSLENDLYDTIKELNNIRLAVPRNGFDVGACVHDDILDVIDYAKSKLKYVEETRMVFEDMIEEQEKFGTYEEQNKQWN